MNRKRKSKIICYIVIITTLTFIITNINKINVNGSFPGEFYEGENFTWVIDSINVGNNLWYNVSTFSFVANWHANVSDEINFSVDGYTSISDEDYLVGDLEIGNLSTKTNNKDIGYNLALSANPWYGSLLSLEFNWETISTITPFNGPDADIAYDKTIAILGQNINAVKIIYEDDFQESILYYEPITGLLLRANTTSGSFNLNMHLTYSSMPLPNISNGLPFYGMIAIITGLGVLVILKKKNYKK
jgi:hypothetical protein